MDYILETVPFTSCDDEPRLHSIIQGLIEKGEVPEYKAFTEENDKKKQRRKRKVSTKQAEFKMLSMNFVHIIELQIVMQIYTFMNTSRGMKCQQKFNFTY